MASKSDFKELLRGAALRVTRPRVAVLATGSELVAPGQPLEPGQIYESNATALAAQAARAGMAEDGR